MHHPRMFMYWLLYNQEVLILVPVLIFSLPYFTGLLYQHQASIVLQSNTRVTEVISKLEQFLGQNWKIEILRDVQLWRLIKSVMRVNTGRDFLFLSHSSFQTCDRLATCQWPVHGAPYLSPNDRRSGAYCWSAHLLSHSGKLNLHYLISLDE